METVLVVVVILAIVAGVVLSKRKSKQEDKPAAPTQAPPISPAVAPFMPPVPPIDADGSKMTRPEWDAYVAYYGKFPTTPAAPTPPRVIPTLPPGPGLPPSFRDEQGFDHGSQAALDDYNRRVAIRNANLKAEEAQAANARYTGPIPARNLSPEDCKFLAWACASDTSFAIRALSGTQQEVANALQTGAYGGEFNALAYTGILRAFLRP